MNTEKDEFYIGYIAKAPPGTSRMMRWLILFVFFFGGCTAILLAWNQRKFASSNFEYGVVTTVEGYFFVAPVPHLQVPLGIAHGKELYQNILLVGEGKAGAMGVINQLEQKMGKSIIGYFVTLKGTLIYKDGKALMSITEGDLIAQPSNNKAYNQPPWKSLGTESVSGEVVDSKCYFGVMKPGEGKVHRSCAVRCLSGGIPPVLRAQVDTYYLLVDLDLRPVNAEILTLVGDQIMLTGECVIWNDWRILKVDADAIRMAASKKWQAQITAFELGIARCETH